MKKILFYIAAVVILNAQTVTEEEKIIKQIALQAHEEYASVLRRAMKSKLQQEGPAKAIEYCYNNANFLTMTTAFNLSRKLKVKIKLKRISFKNRNPFDYPNIYDYKILEKMKKNHLGEKELTISRYKNGIKSYQALYVKKICLKCHGTHLNINVQRALNKYYAKDKAVGYKEGDFRGAIVVTIDKKSLEKYIKNLKKQTDKNK